MFHHILRPRCDVPCKQLGRASAAYLPGELLHAVTWHRVRLDYSPGLLQSTSTPVLHCSTFTEGLHVCLY